MHAINANKRDQGMDRKEFLKFGALGGALAGVSLTAGCSPRQPGGKGSHAAPDAFELDEATVGELQQAMSDGARTAESITRLYMERVEAIDRNGPTLNSVIEMNPDALAIAQQRDSERAEGNVRGPLHGIPVMIKDNIETADRMMTTAGALALSGNIASEDSWVARKLREAGAVILGKTNLSEWANFRSTRSSSGWSARGGQTRNPNVLDRNPCGSSSGSGVAASANLCTLAIGTETNGSVVCPSSANGIVGIKPTLGLWSRSGIIPLAHSQDTAGPMARTVTDAAILLGVLTGTDPDDPVTSQSEGHAHTDYTQFLDPAGLQGMRIGVARNFFGFHAETDAVMEEAIQAMESEGATMVDPADIDPEEELGGAGFDVLLYEFKNDLNAYLQTVHEDVPVSSLAEIIAWNNSHSEESMPWFGQEILEMAQEKGPLSDPEYKEALATIRRVSREQGIDATMSEHNLDAIIAPTGGPAWTIDVLNGDHFGGGSSSPAARAGYPNITVPAGYIHDLPVGLSIFGAPWSEPKLIRIAYAFEQATQARRVPAYRPHLGLPG